MAPASDNDRRMMRGVIDYVQQHGGWEIATREAVPSLPWDDLESFQGHGLIASVWDPAQYERLLAAGLPAVNVYARTETPEVTTVYSDNPAIGRRAADHLLGMGLKRFAFVGRSNLLHDRQRGEGFADALADKGYPCAAIHPDDWTVQPRDAQDTQMIAERLADLEFPVGIFAAHDNLGCEVLDACRRCGIRVPYQAAVVAVNNYELLCETAQPPLSSICQQAERIGYEAMRLLDRLVRKRGRRRKSPPHIALPPGDLVRRRSTDFLAIDDPDVAAALTAIRANAAQPITIDDVLADVMVSRRTLDKKFIAALGHPAAAELHLTRMKIAQQLLAQTEQQILTVAMCSGFASVSGFGRAFRLHAGMTPRQYRKRHGLPRHDD